MTPVFYNWLRKCTKSYKTRQHTDRRFRNNSKAENFYYAENPLNLKDLRGFELVDTNGLEPLTFRTSSGCSTN